MGAFTRNGQKVLWQAGQMAKRICVRAMPVNAQNGTSKIARCHNQNCGRPIKAANATTTLIISATVYGPGSFAKLRAIFPGQTCAQCSLQAHLAQ